MAALLDPLEEYPAAPAPVHCVAAERAAELKRAELRGSLTVWLIEGLRVSAFIGGRVFIVPWLLIWPALIGWIRIVAAHGDFARGLESPLNRSLMGVYVAGALIHSLTVWSAWRYESEASRRLNAYMLHWQATERRNRNYGRRRGDHRVEEDV